MTTKTISYADVDTSSIQVSDLKTSNGRKMAYVNQSKNSRGRFRIQMGDIDDESTFLYCPFGKSEPFADAPPNPNDDRINLEMAVDNDSNLIGLFDNINTKVINEMESRSAEFFGKTTTRELVTHMYQSPLKLSSEEGKSNLLRVKISPSRTKFKVMESNTSDEENIIMRDGTIDDVTQGCKVVPVCDIMPLWFISGRCGMSLTASTIVIIPSDYRVSSNDNGDDVLLTKRKITKITNNDDNDDNDKEGKKLKLDENEQHW